MAPPAARSSMISMPVAISSTDFSALLDHHPAKKKQKKSSSGSCSSSRVCSLSSYGLLLAAFGLMSMLIFVFRLHPSKDNCHSMFPGLSSTILDDKITSRFHYHHKQQEQHQQQHQQHQQEQQLSLLGSVVRRPLASDSSFTDAEKEFWKQPKNQGYRPCLNFSPGYVEATGPIIRDRKNYLVVVVSGGLNQQRNQIIDSVVIARILGAALVIPIMQVNVIWGDESEFSDIFDVDHFKKSLEGDVRVVSSLPSTHLMARHAEEKKTPLDATPVWFRSHYMKRLRKDGVLLLRGLDSRLSKDLPSDLQKLRCKVAFHALRFAAPIQALGDKIVQRMWSRGPYLALHLRLEKDVWVRTGCHSGLGPEYEEEIQLERKLHPKLLTGRSNMTQEERQLSGLCPLTANEVVRLLKGLGASSRTRIYWAGGEPFGGATRALEPLKREFPNVYNKYDLATREELRPFETKASILAAIDYLVALSSDVFMPSHGGNMAHSLKGHRAYTGHRKHITPNKREMLQYFLNTTLDDAEFSSAIVDLHKDSLGQPAMWMGRKGRDVLGYPVPECMCKTSPAGATASRTGEAAARAAARTAEAAARTSQAKTTVTRLLSRGTKWRSMASS